MQKLESSHQHERCSYCIYLLLLLWRHLSNSFMLERVFAKCSSSSRRSEGQNKTLLTSSFQQLCAKASVCKMWFLVSYERRSEYSAAYFTLCQEVCLSNLDLPAPFSILFSLWTFFKHKMMYGVNSFIPLWLYDCVLQRDWPSRLNGQ